MEKFNSLAEVAVERYYFGAGKMGTESKILSISLTENDLDAIYADEDFKLEVYGKEVNYEINAAQMELSFNYSEE